MILKLDKMKKEDKAFIDEKDSDDRVVRLLKASLIVATGEREFLEEVNR